MGIFGVLKGSDEVSAGCCQMDNQVKKDANEKRMSTLCLVLWTEHRAHVHPCVLFASYGHV